jgi:hypothetical protein
MNFHIMEINSAYERTSLISSWRINSTFSLSTSFIVESKRLERLRFFVLFLDMDKGLLSIIVVIFREFFVLFLLSRKRPYTYIYKPSKNGISTHNCKNFSKYEPVHYSLSSKNWYNITIDNLRGSVIFE